MSDFNERFSQYAAEFEAVLESFCSKLDCRPKILADSMKYSLTAGGKRVRPVMMYAAGGLLSVPREELDNFALATELIHTYSLIHDDLPEMDNDDFRRGKPSNHVVFGAGNAVLAGDALLTTACSMLVRECYKGAAQISAAEFLLDCAGIYGMIGGQSADLLHENDPACDEKTLGFIYSNKTAKMLTAPLVIPSVLAGGKYYSELKLFGENIGALFQLTDDILDFKGDFSELGKSTGKDEREGKCTAVALFGADGAELRADMLGDKCLKILEGIEGDVSFFKELVMRVRTRRA